MQYDKVSRQDFKRQSIEHPVTASYQASLFSLRHANAQASTLPNHFIKALLQALEEDSAKHL